MCLLLSILIFWPQGMWDLICPSRDPSHAPCSGRPNLNHWTTREVPERFFKKSTKNTFGASLVSQLLENPPEMQETWVQSLGWGDSPGEGKGYPLQYSGLENSIDCVYSSWGCKELDMTEQPVHSERDQPWDFFGRNGAKAETPVLWLPYAKS